MVLHKPSFLVTLLRLVVSINGPLSRGSERIASKLSFFLPIVIKRLWFVREIEMVVVSFVASIAIIITIIDMRELSIDILVRTSKYGIFYPKCRRLGFLAERWVRSSWQATMASRRCISLEEALAKLAKRPHYKRLQRHVGYLREHVSGTRYRSNLADNSPDIW